MPPLTDCPVRTYLLSRVTGSPVKGQTVPSSSVVHTLYPPVTIYLQPPDSQSGMHLIAKAVRMREARMTFSSKDCHVRKKVSQPISHWQHSICAGRTTIQKTSERSRHQTDGTRLAIRRIAKSPSAIAPVKSTI